MRAAVVRTFGDPPRYEEVPDPLTKDDDEVVVDVVAAGLHPRVRSQAAGTHYTSTDALPLVPGVDGVARDPEGKLRYVVLDDTDRGTMAERTVVDVRRSVVLPDDVDPVVIAAAMNPAMSSWVALRRRIDFAPGQRVAILGATGNAGRLAIQLARHLGASEVVAVGRDAAKLAGLPALGADVACTFDDVGPAAADVDVVLDYVWGEPTGRAIVDILTRRSDRSRPLTWIEIGAIAGPDAVIPAAAFRSARLQIVGSGIGSVPRHDFAAELPALAAHITRSDLAVNPHPVPLAQVTAAWLATPTSTDRVVLVP
jgi:NADPH:quinone reductase-like Zn-dependent oxidoreductase